MFAAENGTWQAGLLDDIEQRLLYVLSIFAQLYFVLRWLVRDTLIANAVEATSNSKMTSVYVKSM